MNTEIAESIEKRHNVIVDAANEMYTHRHYRDDYGWMPIPGIWILRAKIENDAIELDSTKPAIIEHTVDGEKVTTTYAPSTVSDIYFNQKNLIIETGEEIITIDCDTITDIDQDI